MNWQYGLFLFSVQHWFLVSVGYCFHVLTKETEHITKENNNKNNNFIIININHHHHHHQQQQQQQQQKLESQRAYATELITLVGMWLQSNQLQTPHSTPGSHCQTFCKGQATDGSVVGGAPGCRHWQWVHIHGAQLAQRAAPQDCTHHGAAAQPPRQLILLSGQEATAAHCYFPFPQGESSQFWFYITGWNYPGVSLALHIAMVFLYHKASTHGSG